MIEDQLKALSTQHLVELLTRILSSRDDESMHRRSGLRLAQFVYYADETVIQDFVGLADYREVCVDDMDSFAQHFSARLVQSGTCDICHSGIVSYSKSVQCPICDANVECT